MSDAASVTIWIHKLRAGNSQAAQKLWQGYFHRLVALARGKLRTMPRRGADEEDIALSAFDSFFRGVERGRFPQLDDRDDLWQVLLMITERKAFDLLEHEGRQKRDWRRDQSGDAPVGKYGPRGKRTGPSLRGPGRRRMRKAPGGARRFRSATDRRPQDGRLHE